MYSLSGRLRVMTRGHFGLALSLDLGQLVMRTLTAAEHGVQGLGRTVQPECAAERGHGLQQGELDASPRAQRLDLDVRFDALGVQKAGEKEAEEHGGQDGAGRRPAATRPLVTLGQRPERPAAARLAGLALEARRAALRALAGIEPLVPLVVDPVAGAKAPRRVLSPGRRCASRGGRPPSEGTRSGRGRSGRVMSSHTKSSFSGRPSKGRRPAPFSLPPSAMIIHHRVRT